MIKANISTKVLAVGNNDKKGDCKMGILTYVNGDLTYTSKNGVIYDLLEGTTIPDKNEKEKTSDICFVMLHYQEELHEVGDEIAGYFYGANFLATEEDKSEYIEMMDSFAEKYEKKHPEVVEYYARRKVRMMRRIMETVDTYLTINEEVLSEKRIEDLKEQIDFIELAISKERTI